MSEPYLGDIMIVGFNFAPKGWALCDGQLLPIEQNQSLYSLLGTTFGGDGRTSFALPDMRGRAPLHKGQGAGLSNRPMGEKGGQNEVVLTAAEIPSHTHELNASSNPSTVATPAGNLPGTVVAAFNVYGDTLNADGNTGQVTGGGSNAPHNNMEPYLTLNFVIALQGVYPPRN